MEIFSFFNFYYNVIKRSPKKYDIAMGHPSSFIATVTPLFMFIISMFIMFFIPPYLLPLMYLWIPIILGNFLFVNHTSNKGWEIKREEDRKREEARRAEMERKYKERMRRAEEEERRREAEQERMWEEFVRASFERRRRQQQQYQQQQQQRQRQQQSHSQNRANAIKLLGLSEGFTEKDVKKAYRRLSKIHHPDMGGTQENFIRLNKAYNYLMNL